MQWLKRTKYQIINAQKTHTHGRGIGVSIVKNVEEIYLHYIGNEMIVSLIMK